MSNNQIIEEYVRLYYKTGSVIESLNIIKSILNEREYFRFESGLKQILKN